MNPYQKLDEIYKKIPGIKCQGKCQESCGPILMTRLEWQRITKRLGYEPTVTRDLTCPMLDKSGKCSVYHIRPIICRLWGIAKEMPCVFGCIPEKVLLKYEAYKLMEELEEAGK